MINDWLTPNSDVGVPAKSSGYRLTKLYLTYFIPTNTNKLSTINEFLREVPPQS